MTLCCFAEDCLLPARFVRLNAATCSRELCPVEFRIRVLALSTFSPRELHGFRGFPPAFQAPKRTRTTLLAWHRGLWMSIWPDGSCACLGEGCAQGPKVLLSVRPFRPFRPSVSSVPSVPVRRPSPELKFPPSRHSNHLRVLRPRACGGSAFEAFKRVPEGT